MRYQERLCNEHIPLQGNVYQMREPYDHRDAKEVKRWLEKHILYAQLEAEERLKAQAGQGTNPELLNEGQSRRVQWLRTRVYDRLPPLMRPMLYFIYRYILGRGWRDGLTGTYYHILHAFWYQMLIDLFERQAELERKNKL